MKSRIKTFIGLILIVSMTGASCNDSSNLKDREAVLNKKELELNQREASIKNINNLDSVKSQHSSNTKFVFTIIKVDEPEIVTQTIDLNKDAIARWERDEDSRSRAGTTSMSNLPGLIVPCPDHNYYEEHKIYSQYFYFKSDITQVNDFDEDKKYRLIDGYEAVVRNLLFLKDDAYSFKIQYKRTSKIISRECLAFDSYSEASIKRNED